MSLAFIRNYTTALLFSNHSPVSLVICSDTQGFSLFDAEMEISILSFVIT